MGWIMAKNAIIIKIGAWKRLFDIGQPAPEWILYHKIAPRMGKIQIFQSHFVKKVMLMLSIRLKAVILAGEGVRLLMFFSRG
jgi:hypothetical protein